MPVRIDPVTDNTINEIRLNMRELIESGQIIIDGKAVVFEMDKPDEAIAEVLARHGRNYSLSHLRRRIIKQKSSV